MAYRRVIFTSNDPDIIKSDLNRLIATDKFKSDFPDLKTSFKPSVKDDVTIIDINGDGADSVSKKFKDIGIKHQAKVIVRNEIRTNPINESKLKEMIKEELRKTLKKD